MTPPIERVARRLACLNGLNPDTKDYFGDPEWKRFAETVRRVTDELREMGFITSGGIGLIDGCTPPTDAPILRLPHNRQKRK